MVGLMRAKPTEAADRITEIEGRIGRNLRRLRLERAVSQAALANHLGVVHQVVGRFELGVVRIAAGYLPAIAAALGVAIDDLFEDDQVTRRPTVTGQRLAPFMRDVMAITSDESLNALNSVAKLLVKASAGRQAHAAPAEQPASATNSNKAPPKS